MSTAASAEVRLDVSFIEANEESLNLITNEERAFLSLASLDGYIDDDFDCDMLPEKIYEIRYKCCRLRLAHTSLLTLLFLLTICFAVTLVLIVLMVVFVSITSQQSSASSSVVFTVGEQPSYEAIDWLHDPVIEEINHKRFNHTLL